MISDQKKHLQFALLSIILLANLMGMFGMHFFGEHIIWLSIKDLILVLLLAGNLIVFRVLPKNYVLCTLPFLFFLGVSFLSSEAATMAKVASSRQALVPFAIGLLGFYLGSSQEMSRQFIRWHLHALYLLIACSILVYLGLQFEILPIAEYAKSKSLILSYYDVPYMYYDSLTGNMIRNVSSFLDPINMGHAMVFLFVYGLYKAKYSKALLLMIALSLLLTTSKGAVLHLVLALFILERNRFPKWMQYIAFGSLVPLLILASSLHPGVALHLEGFTEALTHLSFFGEDLARTGNQALMYGNDVALPIFDTFIGGIMGQFGLVGLLLWLAPFIFILNKIRKQQWLFVLLLVQLLVACISENTFNFGSIFFLMLSCGYYLRSSRANG